MKNDIAIHQDMFHFSLCRSFLLVTTRMHLIFRDNVWIESESFPFWAALPVWNNVLKYMRNFLNAVAFAVVMDSGNYNTLNTHTHAKLFNVHHIKIHA